MASKLYGVDATIIIFVFVLYCIVSLQNAMFYGNKLHECVHAIRNHVCVGLCDVTSSNEFPIHFHYDHEFIINAFDHVQHARANTICDAHCSKASGKVCV